MLYALRRLDAGTAYLDDRQASLAGAEALPLPLPPLAEQRRIVAAIEEQLSRLDAAEQSLVAARQSWLRLRCGSTGSASRSTHAWLPLGESPSRRRRRHGQQSQDDPSDVESRPEGRERREAIDSR